LTGLARGKRLDLFSSLALVATLGVACSSVQTSYDFDPDADFSAWRTYTWYPTASPATGDLRLDNPLLHDRIVAAVDRSLGARGYARVRNSAPDFYVNYHLSTEQRLEARTMNTAYHAGPGGRRWGDAGWGGVGWQETHVHQFEVGTVVIDFVDAAARRLVWRGSGARRLAPDPSPDRVTQRVNEAVDEILGQFPPR
jgi:hypothetical protein